MTNDKELIKIIIYFWHTFLDRFQVRQVKIKVSKAITFGSEIVIMFENKKSLNSRAPIYNLKSKDVHKYKGI